MKLIKKKHGKDVSADVKAVQKLRREAERAKRSLSNQHQVRVEIEGLFETTRLRFHDLPVRDKGDGLPCSAISARLVNRVPDMTRLLDRLEKAGLVTRHRCTSDRRVVRTRLSEEGTIVLPSYRSCCKRRDSRAPSKLDFAASIWRWRWCAVDDAKIWLSRRNSINGNLSKRKKWVTRLKSQLHVAKTH